jgi:hypothetical protein
VQPIEKKETYLIETLLKINHSHLQWDEEPVFCFTSDIDWASEAVMKDYFSLINIFDIKPTLFVTHDSEEINRAFSKGKVERGVHPNFLNGSSHGNSFREVAEACVKFAPEAYGFRSHRAFDVTDITHMMYNDFNFRYVSHQITVFQPRIKPILHESGLLNFPVFFEDGTHLYNKLDLDISRYREFLFTPGIKIISFHPMNFVFNSPDLAFMRNIKDTLSREEYNNITKDSINTHGNKVNGIRNTVLNIIELVKHHNYTILTMNELFKTFMEAKV